jgi:hypothetical protein
MTKSLVILSERSESKDPFSIDMHMLDEEKRILRLRRLWRLRSE